MHAREPRHSNQRRDLSAVVEDVELVDLIAVSAAIRLELSRHPVGATCDCPALEALALLYERGYRLVKRMTPNHREAVVAHVRATIDSEIQGERGLGYAWTSLEAFEKYEMSLAELWAELDALYPAGRRFPRPPGEN